jgi:hypothetical protein
MKSSKKKVARKRRELADSVAISPEASSLLRDEADLATGEGQAAMQRDLEPDDFDAGTNVFDDRVRGAGGQSLAEMVIAKEQGWGLDEHGGGLRFDQPEPNVNDYDPDEPSDVEPPIMVEESERKTRIA